MWVASAAPEATGFLLEAGAECGQIARPVCATGLQPYKQMGPRSRKAEEMCLGSRNIYRVK